MDCSTPDFSVHHQLPELAQTHVHWVGDAIQPSHPLSSTSPPAPNPSQHQVFSNESALHIRWQSIGASASVLPMNIQDWFPLWLTGFISLQFRGLSRVFSSTMVWKHQFFTVQLSYPYMTIGKTIALTIRFCFCLGWPSLAFSPQYLSHISSFWAQNSVFYQ